MRYKFLSITLVLALLLSMLPAGVLTASAYSETDITYPVEGGNIYFDKASGTITDCDSSVTSADIPAEIDGIAVTSIGDSAFYYCSNLTSVTIPSSVTSIGDSAFRSCYNLTSVIIPDSVTSIGDGAFNDSSSLTGIWVDAANEYYSSNEKGILFNKDKTSLIQCPGGYSGSYAIPDGVMSISDEAFYGCEDLISVTIPDSVTSIGNYVFFGCISLTSAVIGNGLTSTGERTFQCCYNLTNVVFGNNITVIGDYSFVSCALTSITIPEGVTRIGSFAFWRCASLSNVMLPKSLRVIEGGAFEFCASLTDIIIPEGVSGIENYTFQGSGLKNITIPESVTSIGEYAFEACDLNSILIPAGVETIGCLAFASCDDLSAVYFAGDAPVLDYNVFHTYCDGEEGHPIEGLTLYYIEGKEGWTSPTWNGYNTATWEPPHEHEYTAAVTEATCTEQGYTTYTCACGDSYTADEVAALGHDYGQWRVNKAPTCTAEGEEIRSCSRCDSTESRKLAATGHSYTASVTAPTCTEKGYTTYVCACGDSYTADEVAALGHDYGQWRVNMAPTCTAEGEEIRSCSRCDSTESRKLAATGHSYTASVTAPTCTEKGYTTYTCACGDSYTADEVAALGHDYGQWRVNKAPSCTAEGEEIRECSRCDSTESRKLAATGHSYTASVTAPTCTEKGYTTYVCACGDSYTADEVAALGHDYHDGACSRCGEEDPDYESEIPPAEFGDVTEDAWYKDAVDYAVANGLMNGTGNNKFEPERSMTRAMLVTVLWRYAGEPTEGENIFSDVEENQWYTKAVAWAAENGIVGGVGNGKFEPDGEITREQMAAILYRYCNSVGIDTSKRESLNGFPDGDKTSAYAQDAISWAVAEGLIAGSKVNGKLWLAPQGNATRAQVATILMRFLENVAK